MSPAPAVLVTGGAHRIGAAICRRFADEGWHVAIHCNRSVDAAKALAAQMPDAQVVACDLGDVAALRRMVAELAAGLGNWRAVINSASVFTPDDVSELDPDTLADAMQVNARAPALLAQLYLGAGKSNSGRRVIQVTDQKLANPNPDFFSYSMSKHALASTIPMLAMAAGAKDRIYGLAPGAILASHDQSPAEAETSHRLNLLKRRTSASEVADAAWFLATGSLDTGQTLYVDSGQHLLSQPRDVMFLARGEAQ